MVMVDGRISRDEEYFKEGVLKVMEVFGGTINELEEEIRTMDYEARREDERRRPM